jgi:hypothetical protein
MKLIKTFTRSQVQYRDLPDRANPVMFVRWADVEVYRPNTWFWDWLGWNDKEVENWEDWREAPESWNK